MASSCPHLSLLFLLCLYNNLFILTILLNLYFHLSVLTWIFPLHPLHYCHIHLPVLSSSFSFHYGICKKCLSMPTNLYKSQSCTYIALLIILVFYCDLEDFHFFLGSLSLLYKDQGYGM